MSINYHLPWSLETNAHGTTIKDASGIPIGWFKDHLHAEFILHLHITQTVNEERIEALETTLDNNGIDLPE